MPEVNYAERYCGMSEDELLRLIAEKDSLIEPARIALEHEIQARGIDRRASPVGQIEVADRPRPRNAGASRWARLGIFLCVALVSVFVAARVFGAGTSSSFVEQLTKMSLYLALAAWGLSSVVSGPWLTAKRTWIAAIALYGIAFVLVAVFLGKPAAAKLEELNEEQTRLDRQFAETTTGRSLLQPASFASPQVAANSLAEFEQYANATETLDRQKEALLQPDSSRNTLAAFFEATRVAVSATEELYRFTADPSRNVHVENGVVVIADPDGYNKRIDAANEAMDKLRLATAALKQGGSAAGQR
jgi:hypothetical protein